jgi:hypothetical protein
MTKKGPSNPQLCYLTPLNSTGSETHKGNVPRSPLSFF